MSKQNSVDLNYPPKEVYNNKTEKLVDFFSGDCFKSNKFFQENPESLKLILFQDAFEVVNPLGSARTKYKVLAIYMSLGNLPPEIRTHIDNIQLVALVREKWLNHDKVFGRIQEDLAKLETQGIKINPSKIIKGGLICICGDNLGSHGVGGFQESFSQKVEFFCRFCEARNSELHSKYKKDVFSEYSKLRTPESYNLAVIEKENSKQNVSNIKGIKRNSVLNKLKSFHVCNPGLPPCFGHDLTEGVIAYDLLLIIKGLCQYSSLTVNKLNESIKNFPFVLEDGRNKPQPKIALNLDRIVGSAWEIRTLLRFLPLIIFNINPKIKDSIPDIWQSLLLLSEITDIICAPEIHSSYLDYLQSRTEDYLSLRKKLFPEHDLKPKHHYLTHYAYLIKQFDPLIRVWSMRFESKHTFFKNAVRRLRNLRNISGTLSKKHELYQYLLRSGYNLNVKIVPSSMKLLTLDLYSDIIRNLIKSANLTGHLTECNSISVHGVNYRAGNILITKSKYYQEELYAGKINMICLQNESDVYFILERVRTEFIDDLQSYQIIFDKKPEYRCVSIREILHDPLHIYTINNLQLIKLKHEILSDIFN